MSTTIVNYLDGVSHQNPKCEKTLGVDATKTI